MNKRFWYQWTLSSRRSGLHKLNTAGYKDNLDRYRIPSPLFSIPFSRRISHVIQPPLDHLHPIFVDHLSPHLSTRPIKHLFWLLVSCGSQGSTVQRSSPHKCGQKSSYSAFNAVVAAFPQIFHSFSHTHEARPHQWSFLEGRSRCWNKRLKRAHLVQGGVPP